MRTQCPRCLSTFFKPLIAGDGNVPNCCGFCAGANVQPVGSGRHYGWSNTLRVEHPKPLEEQMAAAEAKGFRVQRGSHATRSME